MPAAIDNTPVCVCVVWVRVYVSNLCQFPLSVRITLGRLKLVLHGLGLLMRGVGPSSACQVGHLCYRSTIADRAGIQRASCPGPNSRGSHSRNYHRGLLMFLLLQSLFVMTTAVTAEARVEFPGHLGNSEANLECTSDNFGAKPVASFGAGHPSCRAQPTAHHVVSWSEHASDSAQTWEAHCREPATA